HAAVGRRRSWGRCRTPPNSSGMPGGLVEASFLPLSGGVPVAQGPAAGVDLPLPDEPADALDGGRIVAAGLPADVLAPPPRS
ncbi:hypothetical protein ACFCZV_36835, partial [Streptomyces hydrogenans]|uniref:hypothetical protein n=1 Tax=Streptomyces hydrogenans TaxID=1873719 RepID=UPI0035E164B8